MWKKAIMLAVFIALLSTTVLADWQSPNNCVVRTSCNLQRLVLNNNLTNISGANCYATIRNSTTTLLNNASMYEIEAGFYALNFTPNNTGNYPSSMRCAFNGQEALSDLTFVAKQGVSTFMGFEISIPFALLIIGLIVGSFSVWLGNKIKLMSFKLLVYGAGIGLALLMLAGTFATLDRILSYTDSSSADLLAIKEVLIPFYTGLSWLGMGFIILGIALWVLLLLYELQKAWEASQKKKKMIKQGGSF